jgi:beta-1,4-galactosyltransferase 1
MYKNIIIIPYRNRKEHLDIFIRDALPLFEKYLKPFKVVVIEQNEGKLFNRGIVINIGFNEYREQTEYFFTHDIDIVPKENCVKDIYTKLPSTNNTVMGILTAGSGCNTLGGIIKFNSETFIKANGFPNNMWGWGVEDKALQNRVEFMNINVEKNIISDRKNPLEAENFSIKDDVNDRHQDKDFDSRTHIEYNVFKNLGNESKRNRIMSSGLNNLEYEVLSKEMLHEYVELIKIRV